jgi:carboxylate-amine ligase
VSWGSAPPLSIGVEEELLLVDAGTLDLVPIFEQVVPEPGPRIKAELFACLLEIATAPCPDAGEALSQLRELRAEVAARAEGHGATAIAAERTDRGTTGQMILPYERYERIREQPGEKPTTQVICGRTSTPPCPTPRRRCVRSRESTWLPLLAPSANRRSWRASRTGLRRRAERLPCAHWRHAAASSRLQGRRRRR